jgi:predicted metalloprotease
VTLLCSLAAVLATIGAACASTGSGLTSVRSRPVDGSTPTTSPTAPTTTDRNAPTTTGRQVTTVPATTAPGTRPVVDFGQGRRTKHDFDDFLVKAATDIEDFWAEQFPIVYGKPFTPLKGSIYAIYPGRTDDPTDCDGERITYDRVQGNAFYTDCGDLIAYDDAQLLPQLVQDLGEAAVGVVLAHEFGHAIQSRAGVFDLHLLTVATEQQADCFAGAWAAHVARGESDELKFTDTDVKSGLIAMIQVADPVGIDVTVDANAHGTGFDRVGAFQEGFNNGTKRCADFVNDPPPLVNLTFTNQTDFDNQGNLPFDQISTLIPSSLDKYWNEQMADIGKQFTPPTVQSYPAAGPYPSCPGVDRADFADKAFYCQPTNQILYDDDFALGLYDQLGDFSIGYLISDAYSDAVQDALQSSLTGENRFLLDDCLTGAWVLHIIPQPDGSQIDPDQAIVLSPGDLDEAVTTAVKFGDENASTNRIGSAFEKIEWFRKGVIGGLDACATSLG